MNLRQTLGLAAVCTATLFAGSAFAATSVFETASFQAGENGDYLIDSTDFIGATFTLAQATDVTALDGYFTQYSDGGSLFGAIVAVDALNAVPAANLSGNALAHVVFTPNGDGNDQSVALSAHLKAGTYAVIFGSGLWGADGTSGLVNGQGTLGTPTLFTGDGNSWSASSNTDVRIAVQGVSAVPEPSTLAMLLGGLSLVGVLARRRAA